MSRRTLYRGGTVLSAGEGPPATAVLVQDGRIAWLGADAEAPTADAAVDLDGALVTPAFVDAHVHLSRTGSGMRGVDLAGTRSLAEALALVERAARQRGGRPLLAQSWDETAWPERRPFTSRELDRASFGGVVFAPRVDSHSAVVSSALAAAAGIRRPDGDGLVTTTALRRAYEGWAASLTTAQRRDDIRLALTSAAEAGVAELHEMGGPVTSSAQDVLDVREVAAEPGMPRVVQFWAELVATPEQARAVRDEHDAAGLAGDLNVDGSIGSRTASLSEPYADAQGHRGEAFLSPEQVRDHVAACTRAGIPAGFHVIGDAGMDTVLDGFEAAADQVGLAALRAGGHRLEHVEMVSADGIRRLARLGVAASVQPAFDAAWGGPDGMYATRLGRDRVPGMNPLRDLLDAGVPLLLGSDAPVTPVSPWDGIRAAAHHRDEAQRITPGEALAAHTGGWSVRVGAPAVLTVWDGWAGWADPRTGSLSAPPVDGPVPTARLVLGLSAGQGAGLGAGQGASGVAGTAPAAP